MALTSSSTLTAAFSGTAMNHQSWSPGHQASEKALPHSDQIQSPFGRPVGRMELEMFDRNCSATLPSWRGMQPWDGCLRWAFCTGRGAACAQVLPPPLSTRDCGLHLSAKGRSGEDAAAKKVEYEKPGTQWGESSAFKDKNVDSKRGVSGETRMEQRNSGEMSAFHPTNASREVISL